MKKIFTIIWIILEQFPANILQSLQYVFKTNTINEDLKNECNYANNELYVLKSNVANKSIWTYIGIP